MSVHLCIMCGKCEYPQFIAQSNTQLSRLCFAPMPEMVSSNALISSSLHVAFEMSSNLIEDLIDQSPDQGPRQA